MEPAPAHVHLDPLGGMAGDMFIAAVLDAWPALEPLLAEAVAACRLPPGWHVVHSRRMTAGLDARHFDVCGPAGHGHGTESSGQGHGHHHAHDSGRYADIAARIETMALDAAVRRRAQSIYRLLAECEAIVHGIAVEDVHFHELADWDSMVDIVGAAMLIEALGAPSWSVSPLPLGSGTVRTAHGPLPVPAPATARLLKGFAVHDDGIAGERVTPTGAAILAHLTPTTGRAGLTGRVGVTGLGAGTKEFAGCANVLRLLAFQDASERRPGMAGDRVGIVELDIDDQSPEDLASGIDRLRATAGVLDVVSSQAFGKKGRHVFEVRVLCDPDALEAVAAACLEQTSSLGARVRLSERRLLYRDSHVVSTASGPIGVKIAGRPDGERTAKAEHDDVAAAAANRRERSALSSDVERRAMDATSEQNRERCQEPIEQPIK